MSKENFPKDYIYIILSEFEIETVQFRAMVLVMEKKLWQHENVGFNQKCEFPG